MRFGSGVLGVAMHDETLPKEAHKVAHFCSCVAGRNSARWRSRKQHTQCRREAERNAGNGGRARQGMSEQALSLMRRYAVCSAKQPSEVTMTVKELEKAVAKLSEAELAEFRAWFQQFDMDEWDRQIERDLLSGKLDKLIEQAKRDYAEGNGREL
jgi:hypothetical protein